MNGVSKSVLEESLLALCAGKTNLSLGAATCIVLAVSKQNCSWTGQVDRRSL